MSTPTYNKSDFTVSANAEGYKVYYKEHCIGGASIIGKSKSRGVNRFNDINEYRRSGLRDVEALINGIGNPDMVKQIELIDERLRPIVIDNICSNTLMPDLPSARLLVITKLRSEKLFSFDDVVRCAIAASKHHAQQALVHASRNAKLNERTNDWQERWIDKDSILNAYPDTKISNS